MFAELGPAAAAVLATAAGGAGAAPSGDVIALPNVGEVRVSCPDRPRYSMTFAAYDDRADAVVTVRVAGHPRRTRSVRPGRGFRISVPVRRRSASPARGWRETPDVRWTFRQVTGPGTIRATLTLRLMQGGPDPCTLARSRSTYRVTPHWD